MSEPNVVEIDAIAVEEWDSEQHTPVHAESNLAELVKQSGLDGEWETSTREEPAQASAAAIEKPRTTTNTMRRTGAVPAMPSKVHKTMALPIAVVKPATPASAAATKPAAQAPAAKSATKTAPKTAPKTATKTATKTTATGVAPVVAAAAQTPPATPATAKPAATKTTATGVAPVVPVAAKPVSTKTTATGVAPVVPAAAPASTKTTATGVAPVVPAAAPTFSPFGNEPPRAAPNPAPAAAKPARTDATPAPAAAKPARTDATPAPAAAKPARTDATPAPSAAKPARTDATPAPAAAKAARTDATPAPAPAAAKPARTDATPAPAVAKPARTDATPAPAAAKPARADATPAPAKPARADATPAPAKPARADATPAPAKPARADATPAKPATVAAEAKPAAPAAGEAIAARLAAVAATPRAPSALELPAWPPAPAAATTTQDFEDWDELGGATSVGTQERGQPARAPGEDSVIVDLNAVAKNEHQPAKRAPTYPILTSEQGTTTSGAFVMPAPPVVTPAASMLSTPSPSESSHTERPTSPAIPVAAALSVASPHAAVSSTAWHTPLPLAPPPPEPAPQWPSAAGLEYNGAHGSAPEIPVPARHEPTEPRIERSSLLATVFPTPKSRKKGLLVAAGACVAILVVVLATSGGSAKPAPDRTAAKSNRATSAEVSAPASSATVASTSPAAAVTPAKAKPAAAKVVAAADPAAPTAATEPAKKKPVVAKRRISRGKKPVVVDYDKKPDPTPDQDEALTRARADYATGNRHLFAGEAAAAIVSYRQALASYPNYVAGYRGLGLAFAQQGNKASAVDAFKTYVKLAPTAKDVALIKKRIASLSVR